MSKLVIALQKDDQKIADSLWPEVLSYDFWQIPVSYIWQFSWKVRGEGRDGNWSKALLEDDQLRRPALLFISLSMKAGNETLEMMLDYLIGSTTVDAHEPNEDKLQSPLRDYYGDEALNSGNPAVFYDTLSHLTVLRAKLREYQAATGSQALMLGDLVSFVGMYEAANERIVDSSPYSQGSSAVQLMTVFKAKGLEFGHVFLPQALDDVWGESSRGATNRISLPPNLLPIRRDAVTEDERLRIFFVAITRAKTGLHVTSHTTSYSGKSTKRLKYLNEQEQADGEHKTLIFPEYAQAVNKNDSEAPTLENLERHWHGRHLSALEDLSLRDLLHDRLERYQLSPTHLGNFIDLENCGPQDFFLKTILNFPSAMGPNVEFGNAVHETLEWLQYQCDSQKSLPEKLTIIHRFKEIMKSKKLTPKQIDLFLHRGVIALDTYIETRGDIFLRPAKAEVNFKNEGVFVGVAHLAGKIDRMEIDEIKKTITVVDYKTGNSAAVWKKTTKLHKYAQQLYCYKILIESSRRYKGYKVETGRLEFIEPDDDGIIHSLDITFAPEELERTKQLLQAVWQHVQALSMPDTSAYGTSLSDIKRFEDSLLSTRDYDSSPDAEHLVVS